MRREGVLLLQLTLFCVAFDSAQAQGNNDGHGRCQPRSHGHAACVRSRQHPRILNIARQVLLSHKISYGVNTKLATPCCEAVPLSEHHNDRITTKNLFAF